MGRVSRYTNPNLNDVDSTDTTTLSGTETTNASNNSVQTPLSNPDIYYSYINASFENLKNSHIASLKNNISSYKKECKQLQEQTEQYLKEVYTMKGEFNILSRIYKWIIGGLITIIIAMITYHLKVIVPLLPNTPNIKTKQYAPILDNNTLKTSDTNKQ